MPLTLDPPRKAFEMQHDLINAPPRLSDLHGDELRVALFARADAAKADWLANRQPKSLFARLFARAA